MDEERTLQPGWKYDDAEFSWSGPHFKPASQYMSSHSGLNYPTYDWPLGTTCWYVKVTMNGRNRWYTGDTPQVAVRLACSEIITEIDCMDEMPNDND